MDAVGVVLVTRDGAGEEALFSAGSGCLGGMCPGTALEAVVTGNVRLLLFFVVSLWTMAAEKLRTASCLARTQGMQKPPFYDPSPGDAAVSADVM